MSSIDVSDMKAFINGIEVLKKDGNKVLYPIHVTNIMVTELNLEDKKRNFASFKWLDDKTGKVMNFYPTKLKAKIIPVEVVNGSIQRALEHGLRTACNLAQRHARILAPALDARRRATPGAPRRRVRARR